MARRGGLALTSYWPYRGSSRPGTPDGRTEEVGNVSSSARWVICAILAVVGVLALVVAVIYLTVPIHSLPSFIPGKHPVNGHYHKRGAVAAVIGIVLLAIAAVVGLRSRSGMATTVGSTSDSANVASPGAATLEEPTDAGDTV